ncbi:hypothetical protein BGZ67_008556 [Mortierella alpina]|nr:hypothetical protein BGZ67_008556 [Mortierella alpina]
MSVSSIASVFPLRRKLMEGISVHNGGTYGIELVVIPTMLYKSYITIMVLLVATVSSALPAALDLGDEILPQCINVGGVMCCRRYCYDPTVVETVANDQ